MNLSYIVLFVLAVGPACGQAPGKNWQEDFDNYLQSSYSRLSGKGSSTNALPLLPERPTPEQNLSNVISHLKIATPLSRSDMLPERLAGHYCNPGPTSTGNIIGSGALSGSDLFLFPDLTYVYAEWCDIMPFTIFGKGVWSASNSIVRLVDDGQIHSVDYEAPSVFLAVVLTNTTLRRSFFTNVASDRIFLIRDQRRVIGDCIRIQETDLVYGELERIKLISMLEMIGLKIRIRNLEQKQKQRGEK